jgi:two-component system, OmpR family, sensor kinase
MSSGLSGRLPGPLGRLPIRLRLAASVAGVVFAILIAVAVAVGWTTAHRLRADFNAAVNSQAVNIAGDLRPDYDPVNGSLVFRASPAALSEITNGALRIFTEGGQPYQHTPGAPDMGSPFAASRQVRGYRVANVPQRFGPQGNDTIIVQYGVPVIALAREIHTLELFLALGVLVGTALAFGAGSLVARRAISPIAELTAAASEIARTRDPSRTLPEPIADDEVAELSRTLSGMLSALLEARNETEATLDRQRQFVADASHELRTPLTSVLANLELLVDSSNGADRELAQSALRSTQRMRRLVGDLLLLARADARHAPSREAVDLAETVTLAASELEPASREHVLELDVQAARTLGSRDDLQRVATNLIENAMRHTPAGTHVTASTRTLPDGRTELVVADDGPGIAAEVRDTLFQRFVRGAGDRGGSFGLGLAIVAAVAQAHGGEVAVDESPHGGARFTVRLPAPADRPEPSVSPAQPRLWSEPAGDVAGPT